MGRLSRLEPALLALFLSLSFAKPLPQDPDVSTTISPSIVATTPVIASSSYATPTLKSGNPCAQIASIFGDISVSSVAVPKVSAKLAFDCLNDVPLDAASAEVWLETLKPYIEWQSTTAYLKNPPEGYQEPAVDVWSEFENIQAGVSNGRFRNEYELEFELYRLFQTTHDGHFRYLPNMIGAVFGFGRPVSLISYSTDGTEAPKPYVYADVLAFFGNATFKPSPVQQIDGQDAVTFLETWAQFGSLQDPDALYNNVFYELAQSTLGSSGSGAGTFAGAGRGAYIYPGATTTLKFANGTEATYENFARVLQSLKGITSGEDLYRTFINNVGSPGPPSSVSSAVSPNVSPRPGYPKPVEIQRNNYIGGYYLTEAGYEDVAVLGIASFVGEDDYQDVAYNFLEQAAAAGKKKLIIDVSANGGGTILQGYSLFLNLFPDLEPYGATRFRSHETFDIMGQVASERIFEYPFNYTDPPNPVWTDFAGGLPFVYKADMDIDGKPFTSWRDKNPPNEFYGDNFTSIIRWNLSDPTNTPANEIQVNGYGNRTGLPPSRPFEPENIVLLYDGYCASTCAIFSEFMTQQAGIKTISIGGRPNGEAMQTVGGVKGTNNYPWQFINNLVWDVYSLAPDQAGYFNSTSLYAYTDPDTWEIPFMRGTANSGQVNVRDGIRKGDESQTPLQFVYEAADCRLYYTAEMTVDVTAMWEKVADVTWNGDSCAAGAIGSGKVGEKSTLKSRQAAEKRLRKRRVQMTHSKLQALEDSMMVFTDMEHIKPQQGLMLP